MILGIPLWPEKPPFFDPFSHETAIIQHPFNQRRSPGRVPWRGEQLFGWRY